MKTIKILKDFQSDGVMYFEGKELKITKQNIDKIWKFNEKGLITPLSLRDYSDLKEGLNNYKKDKEEY